MPNTASETALNRLKLKNCNEENNCNIELKEVLKDSLSYDFIRKHLVKKSIFGWPKTVPTKIGLRVIYEKKN